MNSIVFTCPQCKTGQFTSQRALSVHLNSNKCKNLSLWSDTTNKRKHYSIPPSNAQLADSILKNMSKRHDSGLTPNRHSLLVHPTMSQLSMLGKSDEQQFVSSSDDIDFDNSDNFNNHNDQQSQDSSTLVSTTETCASSLIRHINPPPGIKFGIHLQHILSSHRGVDLKLYNEIIHTIQYHATVQNIDFRTTKLYNRNELTMKLSNLYNLNELKQTMHQVTMSDSSIVTVPIFNVKSVLLSMLHDPEKMRHENIAEGYDLFSGKVTSPITQYNEIHTGDLWQEARDDLS